MTRITDDCTDRCATYNPKIHACLDQIIGNGSTGVVYKGFFEESVPAAVKVMQKIYVDCVQNELKTFHELMTNGNVSGAEHLVRYYGKEETPSQFILATELCDTNLLNLVRDRSVPKHDAMRYIKEICRGLHIMHSVPCPIVHRDIKPCNVLLKKNLDGSYTCKLADFGISKKLQNHGSVTTKAAGTSEWMSPACLKAMDNDDTKYKASTKDDIFSLGVLIYFIYFSGRHPYGCHSQRTYNIRNCIRIIDDAIEENFDFQNLVRAMIDDVAANRPNITEVINHPFFWDHDFCLDFIIDVYNVHHTFDNFRQSLESRFNIMNDFGDGGWHDGLDVEWKNYIAGQQSTRKHAKKYKHNKFVDLLGFIRDKFVHRTEWASESNLVSLLRNDERPDGLVDGSSYMRYFARKFPKLIMVLSTTKGIDMLGLNSKFRLPSPSIFDLGPTEKDHCDLRRIIAIEEKRV